MDEFRKFENDNNKEDYNSESIDYTKEIIDCSATEINNSYEEPKMYTGEINNSYEEPRMYTGEINNSYEEPRMYTGEINNSYEEPKVYTGEMNNSYEEPRMYTGEINNSYEEPKMYTGEINNSYEGGINNIPENPWKNVNEQGFYYNNDSMHYVSAADENDNQKYITIKNAESEQKQKNKAKIKKTVAAVSAIAVCCASIGIGAGVGFNASKSYIDKNDELNFAFPETTAESDSLVLNEDNIILTGTNTIAPIINKVKDSVVNISMKAQTTNFFNQVYESTGAGSGIIYDQDDEKVYIVTNNHVIDGANAVFISITGTEQIPASLVGKDASSDLAVIYVLKTDLANAGINEVKTAAFADSDQMEVGEYVLAVGNALGEGKTVTQGIISAQNKEINIDGKKLTVLQTDAAINPGNSGGALINTDGEVVGINTAKLSSSSVEGIGYAIPSSYAKNIINEIKENGSIERPYFGIVGFTINDNFKRTYNLNIDGVFLTKVEEGSSAANAGLISTDIITGFNGKTITTIDELSKEITGCKANDTVSIDFIRNGVTKMSVTATLSNYNQKF